MHIKKLNKVRKEIRGAAIEDIVKHFKGSYTTTLTLKGCPVGLWKRIGKGACELNPFVKIQDKGSHYICLCVNGDYYPLQKLPLNDLCELADYINLY